MRLKEAIGDLNSGRITYVEEEALYDMSKTFDPVDKPAHYNLGEGIECIDYIEQVLGLDGFIAYCRGNMMKYNHRAMYKGNPTEDFAKAQWYLNKVNEKMEEKYK